MHKELTFKLMYSEDYDTIELPLNAYVEESISAMCRSLDIYIGLCWPFKQQIGSIGGVVTWVLRIVEDAS